MSSLTLPNIPEEMVTRREAMDYCTKEMFSASGMDDEVAVEFAMAMYQTMEECPDSYFEEEVVAFEVENFLDYETKFYIRELCYIKAYDAGYMDWGTFQRCRVVLGRIEETLIEEMSQEGSHYVDIHLLTIMPTSL